MHSIEGIIFLLVIVFYILRGIFRGVRAFFGMVQRALAPAQRVIAEEVRQAATQQVKARPDQQRARRPDAGGAAVTDTATSGQFRTQVAQLEAQEARGRAAEMSAASPTPETPPLFRGGDDLVRAVILQEVLGKPLSQRRRGMAYKAHSTDTR